jgi:putative PIN family toxin of toxin-antitoxin system
MMNVVLDTNVLVSALRSSTGASFRILELALQDAFTMHVSTPLLFEYLEVLPQRTSVSMSAVELLLATLLERVQEHEIYYLFRGVLPDDDDAMILEVAIKAQAVIVTHNIRHFAGAETYNITVLQPREFLHRIS